MPETTTLITEADLQAAEQRHKQALEALEDLLNPGGAARKALERALADQPALLASARALITPQPIVCAWCGHPVSPEEVAKDPQAVGKHVFTCEKSPAGRLARDAVELFKGLEDAARRLGCTEESSPAHQHFTCIRDAALRAEDKAREAQAAANLAQAEREQAGRARDEWRASATMVTPPDALAAVQRAQAAEEQLVAARWQISSFQLVAARVVRGVSPDSEIRAPQLAKALEALQLRLKAYEGLVRAYSNTLELADDATDELRQATMLAEFVTAESALAALKAADKEAAGGR